jgi:pimeloyl-ACP methyl ester carboxylesterase
MNGKIVGAPLWLGMKLVVFLLLCVSQTPILSATPRSTHHKTEVSNGALVKLMLGFTNASATVNDIHLHYVVGGSCSPILLLPGWPETWWAYRKIMPELAKTHRVISIDLRGMGASDKPAGGYDKKTMASDISELIRNLGYERVDVVGHDIGAMVAFSLAENHPEQVRRLMMLDTTHPSPAYAALPLLPSGDTFGDRADDNHPYFWWFAFHRVKGLPEQMLEGRAGLEQEWFFHYMLKDDAAIDGRDRAVYATAYSSRDAIRASDAWYQAFNRDISDFAGYSELAMPVMGVGGPAYPRLKALLDTKAPGSLTVQIPGTGHFIAEEKPAALLGYCLTFFD